MATRRFEVPAQPPSNVWGSENIFVPVRAETHHVCTSRYGERDVMFSGWENMMLAGEVDMSATKVASRAFAHGFLYIQVCYVHLGDMQRHR